MSLSPFLQTQVEILHRDQDPFKVIDNMISNYSNKCVGSQLSIVKYEYLRKYQIHHEEFFESMDLALKSETDEELKNILIHWSQLSLDEKVKRFRPGKITGDPFFDRRVMNYIKLIPDFMEYLKLPTDLIETLRMEKDMALMQKSRYVIFIYKIENLRQWIHDILHLSDSVYEKVVAIALSTGRRFIEIIKTGDFEDTDDVNVIMFSGQAKKRSETPGFEEESYPIPVLVESSLIIESIETIRETLDTDKTNQEIHNSYSSYINRVLKRLFIKDSVLSSCIQMPHPETDIKLHDMRRIYAMIAFEMFENSNSLNYFLNSVLGHSDMTQSITYASVKLKDHIHDKRKWNY